MLWILLFTAAIASAAGECYYEEDGRTTCHGPHGIWCTEKLSVILEPEDWIHFPDCKYESISVDGLSTEVYLHKRELNTKSLSLSYMTLRSLRWVDWTHITDFNLFNANLEALTSEMFGRATNVKSLYLDKLNVTSITGLPTTFPKLTDLTITDTPISAIPAMPSTLIRMVMWGNPIARIEPTDLANTSPDSIYITSTRKLEIDHGSLYGISRSKYLRLSGQLDQLPSIQSNRLESLNLDGNPLDRTVLSQTLPSRLRYLSISDTKLSAYITLASHSLERLEWNNYKSPSFPKITALTGLRELSLKNSSIERIGANELPINIKTINLRGSKNLVSIDANAFRSKSQVRLDLRGTKITDFGFLNKPSGTFGSVLFSKDDFDVEC